MATATPQVTRTERYELIKWHRTTDDAFSAGKSLYSKLFEILLSVAGPVVEHYRSDFFHDALWLNENLREVVDKGIPFFYAANDYGTRIGTDVGYVFAFRDHVQVSVSIKNEDSVWVAYVSFFS